MVYNSARFMSVPIEAIIKVYRQQLGEDSFDTLPEYASDFVAFLKSQDNYLFNDVVRKGAFKQYFALLAYDLCENLEREIRKAVVESFVDFRRGKRKSPKSEVQITREILRRRVRILEQEKDATPEIKRADVERVLSPHAGEIENIVRGVFQEQGYTLTTLHRDLLQQLVVLYALKVWIAWTGIVVAGFGERDVFPKITGFRIEFLLEDPQGTGCKVKFEALGTHDTGEPIIIPFAQKDIVHRFVSGIDPKYSEQVRIYTSILLDKYVDAIEQHTKNTALIKAVRKLADDQKREFHLAMRDFEQRHFINAILETVTILPIDELATLAESLVSITTLQKRVTMEEETVGGPVDVAVISKGDGFIWIKRKHYFDAERNPNFFATYYNP